MNMTAITPHRLAGTSAVGLCVAALLAWSLISLFALPITVVCAIAGIAFVRVAWGLTHSARIVPFAMPEFAPPPFEFESERGDTEVALDNVVAMIGSAPAATAPERLPTVHEMQASIARHLGAQVARESEPDAEAEGDAGASDAADELDQAIRDLRRSIG